MFTTECYLMIKKKNGQSSYTPQRWIARVLCWVKEVRLGIIPSRWNSTRTKLQQQRIWEVARTQWGRHINKQWRIGRECLRMLVMFQGFWPWLCTLGKNPPNLTMRNKLYVNHYLINLIWKHRSSDKNRNTEVIFLKKNPMFVYKSFCVVV